MGHNNRSTTKRTQRTKNLGRTALYVLLSGVAYYLATQVAWALCFPNSKVSLFFPPHAVLVSILLLAPTRYWWAYTLAAIGGHLLATQQAHWPFLYSLQCEAFDAVQNLAVAAGLFSFGGAHMVTYTAGEVRDPQRTIPRALVFGVLIVTACYALLNAAYLYVMPISAVAQSTRVAADAASRVLGPQSSAAITAIIIVSALGSLNGIALAGPRVYYAMAHDGLAFRWLGALHPTRHTPHFAIAAQAAWACVLAATNSYRALFTRVVYTEWLFFALLAAGIFVLHRRGEYQPKFLRLAYPALPAIAFISSAAVALNQIWATPRESAMGLGLILLGLPIYFVWSHRNTSKSAAAET